MLGLSQKELENISLENTNDSEVQISTEKFCEFANDARIAINAARLIVRNPIVKLILSLADTVLESLQRKLGCSTSL